jgi:hypothetical protein
MRARTIVWAVVPLAAVLAAGRPQPAQLGKKNYLTPSEAEKIRNADTASKRVKLFLSFGDERLRTFEQEMKRSGRGPHRGEILNDLLNGYSGCVDDAADTIQDALDRGADVGAGVQEMRAQTQKFLDELKKIKSSGGPYLATYQDTLEDAIEGTQDASKDAEKAAQQLEHQPPRRDR